MFGKLLKTASAEVHHKDAPVEHAAAAPAPEAAAAGVAGVQGPASGAQKHEHHFKEVLCERN
jgi:hypothetical protein